MDREKFFDGIKHQPFPGRLTQGQVNGTNYILDEWERRKLTDERHLAYILATTKWETSHTMQPIKEMGSQAYLRGKRYWPWIGRGYVQLTWKRNYEVFREEVKRLFGKDIIERPDDAMFPSAAAYIMFEGMYKGTFTTKKLSNYFNSQKTDWINARRIINGTDKAAAIAAIAKQFHSDIVAARS